MSDAGILEAIVEEVAALVCSGALLRPSGAITADVVLTDDYTQAQQSAWRRPIATAFGPCNWTDLRQREAALLLAPTYTNSDGTALRATVRALGQRFTLQAACHLPARWIGIADDVGADLQNIALSRFVPGSGTGLFPCLLEAYRQGGWPCGWEGAYPQGRLRVFQPPA